MNIEKLILEEQKNKLNELVNCDLKDAKDYLDKFKNK
jgi:hypothetical protein